MQDRARPADEQADVRAAPGMDERSSIAIIENENFYEIRTHLPEVDIEDVTIGVIDGVLTIRAQVTVETQGSLSRFFMIEHRESSVEQSFVLPLDADAQDLTTGFSDGILSILLNRKSVPNVISLFAR
jgi:HSP20 family molecular chaperone IbpA